ncbi:unnamed protein product [Polarella glacialis]|uniref:Tubulin/FtsZ GTPase domain-containing protein n=1 Tax=Polarella glacialis TaxID=89957 RepID=A0A813H0Q5_POLGL|nr:unnamed protein product [Polarella glacialis]
MAQKECICINIGQAGCQVGSATWELFCHEHNIKPDGSRDVDMAIDDDTTYTSFFSETSQGQHVPRAIFVDTDPTTRDEIFASDYGRLFHPEHVLGYKQDCKNNFFEGRSMASQYKIKSLRNTMERLAGVEQLAGEERSLNCLGATVTIVAGRHVRRMVAGGPFRVDVGGPGPEPEDVRGSAPGGSRVRVCPSLTCRELETLRALRLGALCVLSPFRAAGGAGPGGVVLCLKRNLSNNLIHLVH